MKRYIIIFFAFLLTACEIEDIQVIDLEAKLPTQNDPIMLEKNQLVTMITQLSTGSIAFAGYDFYTRKPFFGMWQLTGEIQIRERSAHIYNIGSFDDKLVLHDGNVHVYNEKLEWENTYQADTDFFTSKYNKVTWGSGNKIYHLSTESGYKSSSLKAEGAAVFFPGAEFIHMPTATYAKVRADYSSETRFYLAKYDNAFKFVTSLEIENHTPLFSNRSHYYLGSGNWYNPMDIFQYSADGDLVAEKPDFSIPGHKSSRKYELLDDGNILLYEDNITLSIVSFKTGQSLWSLAGVAGYAVAEDGRLLIATTLRGDKANIFLVDPDY